MKYILDTATDSYRRVLPVRIHGDKTRIRYHNGDERVVSTSRLLDTEDAAIAALAERNHADLIRHHTDAANACDLAAAEYEAKAATARAAAVEHRAALAEACR